MWLECALQGHQRYWARLRLAEGDHILVQTSTRHDGCPSETAQGRRCTVSGDGQQALARETNACIRGAHAVTRHAVSTASHLSIRDDDPAGTMMQRKCPWAEPGWRRLLWVDEEPVIFTVQSLRRTQRR